MEQTINLDDRHVIIKVYRIRATGKDRATLETSIPHEVFEREARRLDLTVQEALEKLVAVWRYNSFNGLHLSFEPKKDLKLRYGTVPPKAVAVEAPKS